MARFILEALSIKEGINHVFLVPGGVIDPLAIELSKSSIHPVVAAHEAGAAYMADGYSRASLNFGVCMGIGGPGVTNMITAVSAAYADRSPILILAGRIPPSWEGTGSFQDSSSSFGIDDITLMRPMTGFTASVPEAEATPRFLRKAIRAIRDVESLPVFLSIAQDVQKKKCEGGSYISPRKGPPRVVDREHAMEVVNIIKGAKYVAILAGNGTVRSGASHELQKFAETYSIPVITTMRAKGVVSEDEKNSFSLGVFGLGGSLWANYVILGDKDKGIQKIDVLLVLGATLNANNTFFGMAPFPADKKMVVVDINANSNRDKEFDPTWVTADVREFLCWMRQNKKRYHRQLSKTNNIRQRWIQSIRKFDKYENAGDRSSSAKPLHPARAIADLRKATNSPEARNAIVVVDSGAHTFFAGHHWESYGPNQFLFLSTTGPMGYGIPLGIGACLAHNRLKAKNIHKEPCICIVGDGSMLMHGMELRTAVKNSIPLIIVVINNSVLGNIYLRYRKSRAARKIAQIEPPEVDWVTFAKGLGAEASRVTNPEDLIEAYEEAFMVARMKQKPFVVDIVCDKEPDAPNQKIVVDKTRQTIVGLGPFAPLPKLKDKTEPQLFHY